MESISNPIGFPWILKFDLADERLRAVTLRQRNGRGASRVPRLVVVTRQDPCWSVPGTVGGAWLHGAQNVDS